jgi:hypothetical protein
MTKNNLFSIENRTINLFDKLKKDSVRKSHNILNSLPQFLRIALIEGSKGWETIFNRYDLLTLVAVSNDFESLIELSDDLKVKKKISPSKTDIKFIDFKEFLESPLVQLSSQEFTIQDFVLSSSYHGTFHISPDKRKDLGILYNEFLVKQPELSLILHFEISECLVKAFSQIREILSGKNDAYNNVNGKQPWAVIAGDLVRFTDNAPALFLNRSYLQIPMRKLDSAGIRVCIDLQLKTQIEKGFIFSYGHRKNETVMRLTYDKSALCVTAINKGSRSICVIRQIPEFQSHRKRLEVSIYPDGYFVVAVDEMLFFSEKAFSSFSLFDGKFIIGGDLSGENNGSFLTSCILIDAINHNYVFSPLHYSGIQRVQSNEGVLMEPNCFHRPCLRPA